MVHDGLELVVVTATASQVNGAIADFQQQNQFQVVKSTDVSPPEKRMRQSGGERSKLGQSNDGDTFGNAKDLIPRVPI